MTKNKDAADVIAASAAPTTLSPYSSAAGTTITTLASATTTTIPAAGGC